MPETTPTNAADGSKGAYWDQYYSRTEQVDRAVPSQFAAFVAGELTAPHRVVEFGCGTGRDSLFFASYGHQVIGIDAAEPAVKRCTRLAEALGEGAQFIAARIDDATLTERVAPSEQPTVVYARFFLHAITEQEEQAFFERAKSLTNEGDLMAVEYRTVRDLSQTKVTDSHYRRFMDPVAFQLEAARHGFEIRYAVEGFGYAKYKQDDAYVARCLLTRR